MAWPACADLQSKTDVSLKYEAHVLDTRVVDITSIDHQMNWYLLL